jgi:plasmid replication initiation protein
MNILLEQYNEEGILDALNNLPNDIDEIYNQAMERIERQSNSDKELAKRVLSWITYACRPLTIKELRYALAVSPKMTGMNARALIFEWKLTSVCAGLVVIDGEQRTIRLAREWDTR